MLRNARWTGKKSEKLYQVKSWGHGYFSVGPSGNIQVHRRRAEPLSIDLMDLVERLLLRGLETPILIRFNDLLIDRLAEIHAAFQHAISEHAYLGNYRCVYPIKVNQQRQVVEQIVKWGASFGFGLEAGSKPELIAVLTLLNDDRPIICNGFKDAEFIEQALMAQKIGRNIVPVIERFAELELILATAERLGVSPQIGIRAKLAARGSGRWESSGGIRSKFGLTATEILRAFTILQQRGIEGCFRLLHFHMGSQITNVLQIKTALIEASRIYVELVQRGAVGLKCLDVGGGLGIDYDGSRTNTESSMNYGLQEYANDVICSVASICDDANVRHPDIISESGRAIVAYHSVLVFNVLGTTQRGNESPPPSFREPVVSPLRDLQNTYADLNVHNVRKSFHDAQQALEMAISTFSAGYMSLDQRSLAERYFWAICFEISKLVQQRDDIPTELQALNYLQAEMYFCNFSLFQSAPDSWAINQLFPIMPIHRLDEEPTESAILGDITCDSDGKVDQFIDRRGTRRTLRLHALGNKPYYLGVFLLGAYQEILGDLHNLFGDTNAAHVNIGDDGEPIVETIIRGETVTEVLEYVQFRSEELVSKLQTAVETAVSKNYITQQEAGRFLRQYEESLHGYTYLK